LNTFFYSLLNQFYLSVFCALQLFSLSQSAENNATFLKLYHSSLHRAVLSHYL
jgi:hypothetical protein